MQFFSLLHANSLMEQSNVTRRALPEKRNNSVARRPVYSVVFLHSDLNQLSLDTVANVRLVPGTTQ